MLHAVGLVNLTLAVPVYQMLSRDKQFLVSHHTTLGDLALLTFVLTALFPLMLALFWVGIVRLLPPRAKPIASGVIVATFSFLYAQSSLNLNPALRTLSFGSTFIALVLGAVGGAMYVKAPPARMIFSIISALPLILSLSLAYQMRDVFSSAAPMPPVASAEPLTDAPPIVMIVFDEFPILSLLDADGDIDALRYPNFARLAERSNWYRYAKTGSSFTPEAVPSILNGAETPPGKLPTLAEHPENLFALLAPTYDLHVIEFATSLSPPHENSTGHYFQNPAARLKLLCSDLAIAYGHRALPPNLASRLPRVQGRWGNFAAPDLDASVKAFTGWMVRRYGNRIGWARKFISSIQPEAKPQLYFLHTNLPHFPWHFTPSGKSFKKSVVNDAMGIYAIAVWGVGQALVDHYYHRHLLQVGFVDRLIGELIDHLESLGLYDETLLVITADHGVAFRGMENSRMFSSENVGEIVFVPLFIKLPGQREGRVSDTPAELIDILPTIADSVGLPALETWEGQVLSESADFRRPNIKVSNFDNKFFHTTFAHALQNLQLQLERKTKMFDLDDDRSTPYWFGPLLPLMGTPWTDIPNPKKKLSIKLNVPHLYESVDPRSPLIPSIASGSIVDPPSDLNLSRCAIVVNGVVQAPAKVFEEDGCTVFYAVIPDEAFTPGRNTIDLVEVGLNTSP